MEHLKTTKSPDGTYDCPINISVQEWLQLLKDGVADDSMLKLLNVYLRCEDHKSTCKGIVDGMHTKAHPSSIISKVVNFAKKVQKALDRFDVVSASDGEPTYWVIPMTGRKLEDGLFEWRLRDELAEALKLYKKYLAECFLEEFPIDSLSSMQLSKYTNLEKDTSFCYWVEVKLKMLGGIQGATSFKFGIYEYNSQPSSKQDQYSYDDKYAWQSRLGDTSRKAYNKVRSMICDIAEDASDGNYQEIEDIELSHMFKWKIAYLYGGLELIPIFNRDMLMKAAGLEGMNVDQSTPYSSMQSYLISKRGDQDKFEYYASLLRMIGEDDETDDTQKTENRKFWLVGYSYGEYGSQYDRFIENNVWEGNGPKAVNDRIESFRKGDVLILKATSTKGKKHDQPFLRIKNVAVVESEKAELMPDTNYTLKVKYLDVPETDFDGSKYGKYRQTVHLCDNQEIINYVSQYLNSDGMEKKTSKYPEYIKLLKNCRNLILTGAPGTGKTYMAREIAEEMGECEFVQFHPSFDYTDFVEGLRPIKDENGQLGFERRDGIFKAFCKRALKNLRDSERSQKDLEYSADITNRLNEFLNDAIENERSFKTTTGTKFFISSFENGLLSIRIPDNDKANQLKVKISQISDILENNVELNKVYDIRDYFGQQFGTQQNSYIFVICKEVRKYKTQSNIKVDAEKRKDFVFVVDEINRGDLSKIFGELFFSLDPGYRGVKGLVKTQYQNLVDEDDVFAKGFFIPENVYLIGTMNDIDRSVESMDFAMRRRFTWKEIAPEDRIGMWGNATWKDAADERMSSLNKAISEIRGLGVEYSIGPSYFLKLNDNGADFENLWEMNLKFLLSEYLRGFADKNDLIEKLHKAYQLES